MKRRIKPKAGQESVWDYPRPPRLEPCSDTLRVVHAGTILAETRAGFRVLETSHPPVYYFPPGDVRTDLLTASLASGSFCEWKGGAVYWDLLLPGASIEHLAWSYPAPTRAFQPIRDYLAFYAAKVDACYVGDERAQPQPGGFYGGWVTSKVVGPFKGGPGTWGW